ncbi:hypothetical protein [Pseudomonas fluorescens]|uniref:hypothetical protein n=1 Tax=Pseudomonas fluorescens TaxID=294 RepID=UPI0012402CF4|nr:hypothetical protein [Pseudomonas fluorescens]
MAALGRKLQWEVVVMNIYGRRSSEVRISPSPATFSKHKPLIFQEKVEVCGFWRLKKGHMGLRWDWGAILVRKMATGEWVTDLRHPFDELGFCEPNSKEGCYAK